MDRRLRAGYCISIVAFSANDSQQQQSSRSHRVEANNLRSSMPSVDACRKRASRSMILPHPDLRSEGASAPSRNADWSVSTSFVPLPSAMNSTVHRVIDVGFSFSCMVPALTMRVFGPMSRSSAAPVDCVAFRSEARVLLAADPEILFELGDFPIVASRPVPLRTRFCIGEGMEDLLQCNSEAMLDNGGGMNDARWFHLDFVLRVEEQTSARQP